MNEMDDIQTQAARIEELLRAHDDILVAAHASPDGDAVGATIAMGLLLRALGKRFALYNASGLPERYRGLSTPPAFYASRAALPFRPKLVVTVDCGDPARLGPELAAALPALPSVNLDHHPDNPHYGSLANWVEPSFAAAGQLVAEIASVAGVALTGELAEALYFSLLSDTGAFAYDNTTAREFRLAAELVDNGLSPARARELLNAPWSLRKSRLWGFLFSGLTPYFDGRLLLATVRLEDFAAFGASSEDLEGLVECLRRHEGVLVAAVLHEEIPGFCKLSLRSFGSTDVRAAAARLGGGGHMHAAGATLHEPLEKALPRVLEAAGEIPELADSAA